MNIYYLSSKNTDDAAFFVCNYIKDAIDVFHERYEYYPDSVEKINDDNEPVLIKE